MLTVEQWKSIRRVDHLTLPAVSFRRGFYWAHPRYRDPSDRPDLKVFDRRIEEFLAANNDFDRVTCLANILEATAHFVAVRKTNDRYGEAVNTLHNHALTDLGRIVGHDHQKDMEDYITGTAQPHRLLVLNVIFLTPVGGQVPVNLPGRVTDHVLAANSSRAFLAAGLTVVRARGTTYTHVTQFQSGSILLAGNDIPTNVRGKLQPDMAASGGRLIQYCNSLGATHGRKCVDIVYIPDFELSNVAGRTLRAGVNCAGETPDRPIVLVNANPSPELVARGGLETTLAHELGHAICGCGQHSKVPTCLMADGNSRNGTDQLSLGQRAWFCSNAWIR